MKHFKFTIIISLCFFWGPTFSQTKNKVAVFTIIANAGEAIPDSIQAGYFKGIIGENNPFRKHLKVEKSRDGKFTFTLPADQPVTPITIWFWFAGKDARLGGTYYAEPSDNIVIKFSKQTDSLRKYYDGHTNTVALNFSGKGASKYRLQKKMAEMGMANWVSESNKYKNVFGLQNAKGKLSSPDFFRSTEFKSYLHELFNNIYTDRKILFDTLANYAPTIGKEMTNFLRSEMDSYCYTFATRMEVLLRLSKSESAKQAISDFYFSKANSLKPEIKSAWFKYGFAFRKVESLLIAYQLRFQNLGKGFSFELQYEAVKREKNTELRDILVTKLFVQSDNFTLFINDPSKRDSCLLDAIQTVKNPVLKLMLREQLQFNNGSVIENFSFLDWNGGAVTRESLKGKVFMMDFYFLGCNGCSMFAKRFEKEVFPEFASNPDFKLLSISIDEKKENWVKAIKSGLYTQESSINVTGGSYLHPFLKHYGITRFPCVILVDKAGKTIMFNLQGLSSEAISLKLRSALKNTKSK